jgi:hypothetical protein
MQKPSLSRRMVSLAERTARWRRQVVARRVDWYYFIERLEEIFIDRRRNSSDPFVFGGNVLVGVVRE